MLTRWASSRFGCEIHPQAQSLPPAPSTWANKSTSAPRRLPPRTQGFCGAKEHPLAAAQVDARALVVPLAGHVVVPLALAGDVALDAASARHGWRGHWSLACRLLALAAAVVRGHLDRPMPEIAPLLARIGFVCDECRRVLAIRDRPTGSHHPAVERLPLDEALRDHPAVAVRVLGLATNGLVQQVAVQRGGGPPAAGPGAPVFGRTLLGAFRGIDAPQADALLRHGQGVPVRDGRAAGQLCSHARNRRKSQQQNHQTLRHYRQPLSFRQIQPSAPFRTESGL